MKRVSLFAAALVVAMVCSAGLRAEDAPGAAKKEVGTWTGTVACAHCNYSAQTKAEKCAAAVKVGEKVYLLKADEKADEATKEKIKNYKKELVGEFTIKGNIEEKEGQSVIVASTVTAKQ